MFLSPEYKGEGGGGEIARGGYKNSQKIVSGRGGSWNCREVEFLKDFFRKQTGIFSDKKT